MEANNFERQPNGGVSFTELINALQREGIDAYSMPLPVISYDEHATGYIGGLDEPDYPVRGFARSQQEDYQIGATLRSMYRYIGRDEERSMAVFIEASHDKNSTQIAIPASAEDCNALALLDGRKIAADMTVTGEKYPARKYPATGSHDDSIPAHLVTIHGLEPLYEGTTSAHSLEYSSDYPEGSEELIGRPDLLLVGEATRFLSYEELTNEFELHKTPENWPIVRPKLIEIKYGQDQEKTVYYALYDPIKDIFPIKIDGAEDPFKYTVLPGDRIAARLQLPPPEGLLITGKDGSTASLVLNTVTEPYPVKLLAPGEQRRVSQQDENAFMEEKIEQLRQAETPVARADILYAILQRRYNPDRDNIVVLSQDDKAAIKEIVERMEQVEPEGDLPVCAWLFKGYSTASNEDLESLKSLAAYGLIESPESVLKWSRKDLVTYCKSQLDTLDGQSPMNQAGITSLYRLAMRRCHQEGIDELIEHMLDNPTAMQSIQRGDMRNSVYKAAFSQMRLYAQHNHLLPKLIKTIMSQGTVPLELLKGFSATAIDMLSHGHVTPEWRSIGVGLQRQVNEMLETLQNMPANTVLNEEMRATPDLYIHELTASSGGLARAITSLNQSS